MDMMAIRRRIMMAQKRLPKEYQEVEYIESAGPQSISTSISAANLITANFSGTVHAGKHGFTGIALLLDERPELVWAEK